MYAITVWQPNASLIAEKIKNIETRGRRSPWSSAIGETIAIHAAMRRVPEWSGGGYHVTHDAGSGERHLYAHDARRAFIGDAIALPLGAVVAVCTLVDVVPIGDRWGIAHERAKSGVRGRAVMRRDHRIFGGDTDGLWIISSDGGRGDVDGYAEEQIPYGDFTIVHPPRWALLLDNVQKVEPFPCRGFQGLWKLPDHVADNLVSGCA